MAWYKRYSVPFQSFKGKQYVVNIYEQSNGSVVTLTGAEEPFMTQEEESDDIFTPIRTQTGYLRVIDETQAGNLLEMLIPQNNVEKLVRLYLGHYNNGTFVEDRMMWHGFLCADVYTQPWDNQKKMLEFPVKSVLSAMEDVFLPENYLGDEINIAKVFVDAYTALQETPSSVYVINNLDDAETDFLNVRVEMAAFFTEETISNEAESHVEYIPSSFFDAITSVAKLYGIQVREHHGNLYLAMYDNGDGKIGNLQIPLWSNFVSIANGTPYHGSMIGVTETPLLDYVEFMGDNNTAGFVLGGKDAKVVVNLGGLTFGIELPSTDETADTPIEFQLYNGKLYVQPHPPRTLVEDFYYEYYSQGTQIGGSEYAVMVQKTLINGYTSNPYASENTYLYTGAFPCRWFCQTGTDQVVLKNGLYMNTQYRTSVNMGFDITPDVLYTITSKLKLKAADGWIRIDFEWHNLIWAQIHSGDDVRNYYFDDAAQELGHDVRSQVQVSVQVGDKFWNGTEWVENGRPYLDYVTLFITNNKINTNKTQDMNIAEDGGYYIPITEATDAQVSVHIMNFVPVSTSDSVYRYCYSHILNDLEVSHVRSVSIVASQRGSNTYRKSILSKGFSDEKVVSTNIGTMNNNVPSSCFLKRTITQYIESLTYYADGGTTYTMRPEMNLLNRICAQFDRLRRTFIAIMQNPFSLSQTYDFFQIRFTYLGKKFFGVIKKNNWIDDKQEVKFIEVS